MQSGFEMEIKRHWLGQQWYLPGAAGNDINKVWFDWNLCLKLTSIFPVDECARLPTSIQARDSSGGTAHDLFGLEPGAGR